LCPAIGESPSAICLSEPGSFQLEVRGAEFRYRNQRTRLRIPSLRILPGEQVVVVGENGAGKSTLAKLITRIYDLDLGSICIGGEDIRNIQLDNLRRNVCYLPRDPVLFQGSLASNLRFVRATASNDELEAALRHAGLSAFLATLDDGLRQEIGPAGCRLSGGEGQRVAIARAMLQRPRILILDEATSCLDPVSEQLVLHNVRRHLRASTILVVSHRLSTVASFPRVLVLSAGRIVEDGSPDQLGSSSGAFARLFSSDDFSPQRDHPASRG
jgi:subfamily B ATP-binding cassette protein MsbA